MILEYLEKFKDRDFLNDLKKYKKDILKKLKFIIDKDKEGLEVLKKVYGEFYFLIDYLLIILLSHTPYYNFFIKSYSELMKDYVEISRKVRVWEFIKVAGKANNNDLFLERLDVNNGYVDISEVKDIYAKEMIRVELKELGEMARKIKLPNEEIIKELLDEISIYLKDKVKYSFGGVKVDKVVKDIPLEWHPPCIRKILEDILSGGSPSHYARRSFVVYWFAAKFNPNLRPLDKDGNLVNLSALDIAKEEEIEKFIDEMIEIFKNVDDFNEEKTRYYIMHNIGYKVGHQRFTHCEYCKNWKDDKGKGLKEYCNPDEICMKKFIIHPLDYLCYKMKSEKHDK
ncbi:DNA primase, large subunit [Methanocaldococcus villosus KIN24-T80]|uniref:DNA primase large subunit PriL n=1 Tax=Methanocaldococcus villosus KIN24-T80 TaxID=1069083 RepID=N6UWT5_9EURY|nr:DNA primase large subunit [Methanocaldococcus villosus]ENN96804.1 DNA primase, large subunit [Methanocaldococcus villosus KIN24-T80]